MSDITIAALHAFRAVARCGSFTAAADDLGCSQSAISRHIALLEESTRQTLVLRGHRRIQLTPAGTLYLETVQRALQELERGTERLASHAQRPHSVKILAMPSLAARWLVPRLARLHLAGIDADIELATSIWDTDYRKERFDIGIHYGDGSLPGAQLLMHDSLVPVIAPRLAHDRPVRTLEDLGRFPWLHDALRSSKWPQWLAACNAPQLTGIRHLKLQDAELTLSAAVAGLGIAIGHEVLVAHDIAEGRLVKAWPQPLPMAAGYHLLVPTRSKDKPQIQAIAQWLLREARTAEATPKA